MPQRLGEYRDRLIVQSRTETRDAAGQPTRSWSEHDILWGKRTDGAGSEGPEEDTRRAAQSAEFRTHLTRGIVPKMRLLAPGAVTTLASGVSSATDTSLEVSAADGFPPEGDYRARIEDELVNVTSGQGTTSWTVERGVDGTNAATSYATGTTVQHMEAFDISAAWNDWRLGAETVITAERSDGGS